DHVHVTPGGNRRGRFGPCWPTPARGRPAGLDHHRQPATMLTISTITRMASSTRTSLRAFSSRGRLLGSTVSATSVSGVPSRFGSKVSSCRHSWRRIVILRVMEILSVDMDDLPDIGPEMGTGAICQRVRETYS